MKFIHNILRFVISLFNHAAVHDHFSYNIADTPQKFVQTAQRPWFGCRLEFEISWSHKRNCWKSIWIDFSSSLLRATVNRNSDFMVTLSVSHIRLLLSPVYMRHWKMHNAALQPYGMHVVFTCCAWSCIHFSISANRINKTDMIPFRNASKRHTEIKMQYMYQKLMQNDIYIPIYFIVREQAH